VTVKYPEIEVQELLKWLLGETYALHEHFEAITIADLKIPYTGTATGGGTAAVYLDNEPSALALSSGGVDNDGYKLESDRTFSLAALGGQTLIIEFKARISSEADIYFSMGIINATTNDDFLLVHMDTDAGAPVDDGCLRSQVDGGGINNALAALASTLDLTAYHIYVDDVLECAESVGANIPADQSYRVTMELIQRAIGAAKLLYVDYYKVSSR